ncbi:hypothetical protein [Bacillus mycoides]|uniref:hypothetical protein n=1 Tax=Bacillus mycoides TaxID=1405 RepID=UPI00273B6729|nr:hypothetical protein [Bacillus mycoides]
MQFSIDAIRNFLIQDTECYCEIIIQENAYDNTKWNYTTFINMNNCFLTESGSGAKNDVIVYTSNIHK